MSRLVKIFFSYLFVGCLGAAIAIAAIRSYPSYANSKYFKSINIRSASPNCSKCLANNTSYFSKILDSARKSVVHVRVTHKPDFFRWGVDDITRDLDSWFGQLDDSLRINVRQVQGIHSFYEGSGAIFSSDGYILTSAYLLYGVERVQVTTYDNKVYEAQVIGIDRNSGLALLKISPEEKLFPAKLANMDGVAIGQWVISLGYDDSLSHGVIRYYIPHHFIMTDLSLTVKSIGGLLLDMNGNLLGLNTPHVDFSSNFSLVIPSDYASRIVLELKKKGFIKPTYLGVVAQNLSPDLAASFKLKPNSCVLVSQVMAGSPALSAGITSGDCISHFENTPVTSAGTLYSLITTHDNTKPATIVLWRDGSQQKIIVEWNNRKISANIPPFHFYEPMGIYLREMLPSELDDAHTKAGLLIGNIINTGTAYKVGLRSGDILVAMNGKPLKELSQFDEMINSPVKSAAFLIQRDSDRAFVAIEKAESAKK
ncbi:MULTISPECIES: trypsin-like peptidase domain-containing protein [Candidatus Ichthyocystis]|uniref:trypsin-like peptidase domain-containing protein n=1 Tax=Candidatus Ichthyocystis TaxID=2929841 RepID=UPI000B86F003|nr:MULTISPECIES: trypsin-like peptidase domain-containing protein [Ichthyocystis]